MFWRWWRLDEYDRQRVWPNYGRFSAVVCVSSVAGAVAAVTWALWLADYHRSDYRADGITFGSVDFFDAISFYAQVSSPDAPPPPPCRLVFLLSCFSLCSNCPQGLRKLVAFCCFYPLSLVSYLIATLLVLDRLMSFSKLTATSTKSSWAVWWRVVAGVVVAGAIVSVLCNIAASVFFARAADTYDEIAAGTRNLTRTITRSTAAEYLDQATKFTAFMFAYEALMLLVLIISFFAVGVASARRVQLVLRSASDSATSMKGSIERKKRTVETPRQLMRKIVNTCGVIFVSLLLRAVPSIMYAIAAGLQHIRASCDAHTDLSRCGECYDVYTHMFVWILYTPSLHFAVLLLSQPVAMLVALWGMTSGQTLAVMKESSAEQAEK
jgi:hypothetical protein